MSRRRWRVAASVLGVALVGAAAIYWDTYHFEPYYPRLYRLSVTVPRLPAGFDGLTVAVLGDWHLVGAGARERRVAHLIRATQPDVIALVGDMVEDDGATPGPQSASLCAPELARALRPLRAGLAKVACLGNWDMDPVPGTLREAGFHLVEDGPFTMVTGGGRLVFVSGRHLAATEAGSAGREDEAYIVLSHVPEFADELVGAGADVVLSGHWHGGQVCLPFVGTLGAETARYPLGLYDLGLGKLYVTRGVGFHTEPVRLFCRSEVSLLTLRCS
jgi:uncharacterized protein